MEHINQRQNKLILQEWYQQTEQIKKLFKRFSAYSSSNSELSNVNQLYQNLQEVAYRQLFISQNYDAPNQTTSTGENSMIEYIQTDIKCNNSQNKLKNKYNYSEDGEFNNFNFKKKIQPINQKKQAKKIFSSIKFDKIDQGLYFDDSDQKKTLNLQLITEKVNQNILNKRIFREVKIRKMQEAPQYELYQPEFKTLNGKKMIINKEIDLKQEKKLILNKKKLNANELQIILKQMMQNLEILQLKQCEIIIQDKEKISNNQSNLKTISISKGIQKQQKTNTWQLKLNNFDNLKQLILRDTQITKVELKSLPKLQKINLSGCKHLPEVTLNGLDNLTQFILSYTQITKLELKSLPKLQKIDLSGCQHLPEVTLNEFDNLTQFILRDTQIKKLELKSLPKLQKIDLSWCKHLPEMIGDGLDNLTYLDMSYSKIKKLALISLRKLQKINLSKCIQLNEIDLRESYSLIQLDLRYSKIKKLNLKSMPNLNTLNLSGCIQLKQLNLKGFNKLTYLNLRCTKINKLNLCQLPRLHKLNLSECFQLSQLYLDKLDDLTYLILNSSMKKQNILNLLNLLIKLKSLKYLELSFFDMQQEITLKGFINLTQINLKNNKSTKKINIQSNQNLNWINLSGCSSLMEINLNGLHNLTSLNLSNTKIKELTLSYMQKLKLLNLSDCLQLIQINLSFFDNLTHLQLVNTNVQRIILKSTPKLKELNLIRSSQAVLITLIDVFSNYQQINIKSFQSKHKFNANSKFYDIVCSQQKKYYMIVLKNKKCQAYDIYLCAQARFQDIPDLNQKQKTNNSQNSDLIFFFQKISNLRRELDEAFLDYQENSQSYKQKVKKLMKDILQTTGKFDQQLKILENNIKQADMSSLMKISQFKQALKLQPLERSKKLQRFALLFQNNEQDNNMMLCIKLKETEIITKIFYLGIKQIKQSFSIVFQYGSGIQQNVIIIYLCNMYLKLMKLMSLAKNNKATQISLSKQFQHFKNYIKYQLKESLQQFIQHKSIKADHILKSIKYAIPDSLQNNDKQIQKNTKYQKVENFENIQLRQLRQLQQQFIFFTTKYFNSFQYSLINYKETFDQSVFKLKSKIFVLVLVLQSVIKICEQRIDQNVDKKERARSQSNFQFLLYQKLLIIEEKIEPSDAMKQQLQKVKSQNK